MKAATLINFMPHLVDIYIIALCSEKIHAMHRDASFFENEVRDCQASKQKKEFDMVSVRESSIQP